MAFWGVVSSGRRLRQDQCVAWLEAAASVFLGVGSASVWFVSPPNNLPSSDPFGCSLFFRSGVFQSVDCCVVPSSFSFNKNPCYIWFCSSVDSPQNLLLRRAFCASSPSSVLSKRVGLDGIRVSPATFWYSFIFFSVMFSLSIACTGKKPALALLPAETWLLAPFNLHSGGPPSGLWGHRSLSEVEGVAWTASGEISSDQRHLSAAGAKASLYIMASVKRFLVPEGRRSMCMSIIHGIGDISSPVSMAVLDQ